MPFAAVENTHVTEPAPAGPARAVVPALPRGRSRWVRKIHLVIGLVCTLNFMMLLVSGFLIQHREAFRLEERMVGRSWLPSGYRPADPDSAVRADIVLTDLHSGRLFGRYGTLLVDAMTVAWFLMIATGIGIVLVRRLKFENGHANGGGGRNAGE